MDRRQESGAPPKRALALDLARGFMLLLIVLAHAPLYLYASQPGIMSRPESVHVMDNLINSFGELFIDNRARPMFAVLFGYGLVMIYESQIQKGRTVKEAMKAIKRRAFYLILFGIVLAVGIGGQDILMAYGIAGLLVCWLLPRRDKVLMTAASTLLVISVLYLPLIWGFVVEGNGGYGFGTEFSHDDRYVALVMDALFFFPVIPLFIHLLFPILPSVLAGLWMGRKQLLTKSEQHPKRLKILAVTGMAISVLGALPLMLIDEVWQPSLFLAGMANGIQIVTGIAGGVGYAALFGILGSFIKAPGPIVNSLAALGKRSLTFFIFNEAALVFLLSPVALNLGGILNNTWATVIAAMVWAVSVFFAAVLEKMHLNGPLETLMRRLAYKNQGL
jgi:uncharacterized protein